MKINEVIIVEGEHDATRLKQLFAVDIIVTNGSAISKKTLNLISEVSKTRGIIVFCDPDYPGEQIRKKIMAVVPDAKHAFIKKDLALDERKGKVGVEHASDEDLIKSLENIVHFKESESLAYQDYLRLSFGGNKQRRIILCDKLNIGYCNAKTLYKRLNMLALSYDDLIKIMGEENE